MSQNDVANWSEVADQWIAWVRTDGHDPFWAYRAAFERFVGAGPGQGVEIGAGEGRICRVLTELGYTMTAVEPVPAFLAAARASQSAVDYVAASAEQVPLDRRAFDVVVLYNVLMDVADMPGAVAEAARLLRPGGRVIIGLVHPIFDIFIRAKRGDAQPLYFGETPFDMAAQDNGLSMRFRGWQRPLADYINVCASAGLFITQIEEPQPDPTHPAAQRLPNSRIVPMFLWLELRAGEDLAKRDDR